MKTVILVLSLLPLLAQSFLPPQSPSSGRKLNLNSRQGVPWSTHFGGIQSQSSLHAVNIIIAGAPASGKGTQCEFIKKEFGVVHLSTGDMLRSAVAEGTQVGLVAKDFMDSGKLVPDDVIIGVVR